VVLNNHNPLIRVDPENRCAVMLVYGCHLVVLPFGAKYHKIQENEKYTHDR